MTRFKKRENIINDLYTYLKNLNFSANQIEIPPKIFIEMEGEFIDYEKNKSLAVRFPIKEHYKNPFGFMQGGMITVAVDCTIGPLSFLVAKKPSYTTHLNNTFIRPVRFNENYIDVLATVVECTKRQVHIEAEVKNKSGKVCAKAFGSSLIVKG